MKVIIQNRHTYAGPQRETNSGEQLTVPNQSVPLKDLLDRYTKGGAVTVLQPVYDAGSDLPDISKMDALERLEMAKNIKSAIAKAQADNEKKRNTPPPVVEKSEE